LLGGVVDVEGGQHGFNVALHVRVLNLNRHALEHLGAGFDLEPKVHVMPAARRPVGVAQ
jgi:hypothetical protein